MAPPVDVEELTGSDLSDQDGSKIGTVKGVCGGKEDEPMWVSVKASFSMMQSRELVIPIARIKHEHGVFLVPYSLKHIEATPEVEPSDDEFSAEDDRALRDHFGIDRADAEVRTDNESYAAAVVEGPGSPPPEAYETPDADEFKKDGEDSDNSAPPWEQEGGGHAESDEERAKRLDPDVSASDDEESGDGSDSSEGDTSPQSKSNSTSTETDSSADGDRSDGDRAEGDRLHGDRSDADRDEARAE